MRVFSIRIHVRTDIYKYAHKYIAFKVLRLITGIITMASSSMDNFLFLFPAIPKKASARCFSVVKRFVTLFESWKPRKYSCSVKVWTVGSRPFAFRNNKIKLLMLVYSLTLSFIIISFFPLLPEFIVVGHRETLLSRILHLTHYYTSTYTTEIIYKSDDKSEI